MSSAKKIYLAVASGLVAVGIVLAGVGYALSGFDSAVFSTQVDMRDGSIVLGGVEVDDPTGLPLIEQIADLGTVDTSGVIEPETPEVLAQPEAPEAPAEPEAPEAPAAMP